MRVVKAIETVNDGFAFWIRPKSRKPQVGKNGIKHGFAKFTESLCEHFDGTITVIRAGYSDRTRNYGRPSIDLYTCSRIRDKSWKGWPQGKSEIEFAHRNRVKFREIKWYPPG